MFEWFVAGAVCVCVVLAVNSPSFDRCTSGFFNRIVYDIKHCKWFKK